MRGGLARTRAPRLCRALACLSAGSAPRRLCLIDGHNMAYRMFFAMPELTTPAGEPVHALLGFCNKLHSLPGVFPDASFAVVFDDGGSDVRKAAYPAYKQARPKMPGDLASQISAMRTACDAFGVPRLSVRGVEADDLIASSVARACAAGFDAVTVVSSDKDLLQLVGSSGTDVTVYDDRQKMQLDSAAVVRKFGVGPDQLVDYLALAGDASDGVPGVPGVGPKTAAKLLNEFGDLDAVLAAAAEGGSMKKSKRRESLREFADQARSRRVFPARDLGARSRRDLRRRASRGRSCSSTPTWRLTRRVRSARRLRSLQTCRSSYRSSSVTGSTRSAADASRPRFRARRRSMRTAEVHTPIRYRPRGLDDRTIDVRVVATL